MPIQDQLGPLVTEAQSVLTSPVERELFCVAYYPDWLSDLPDAPLSDATWNTQLANLSPADAEQLRKQLVRWQLLRSGKLPPPATVAEKPQPLAPRAPLRHLQPGTQYHPDLHVPSPDLETWIPEELHGGAHVNLLGADQQGKSWWIQHILKTLRQQHVDIKSVYLDLSRWSTDVLDQHHSLFRHLRDELIQWLKLTPSELSGIRTNPESLNDVWPMLAAYHQRPECSTQRLVLAMEGTNALLDSSIGHKFFSTLRSLVQDTHYVSVLLSFSSQPVVEIGGQQRSAWSLGNTYKIPDFRQEQLAALAEKYGVALGKDDEQRLWKLLCGQPYLVRWALYRACRENSRPLSSLLENAACLSDGGTLFHLYLHGLRSRLAGEEMDTLGKVYTQAGRGCPKEHLDRLTIQGLIVPHEQGGHRLHCRLFLHLLRQ